LNFSEQNRIYDLLETGVLDGAKRLSPGKRGLLYPEQE